MTHVSNLLPQLGLTVKGLWELELELEYIQIRNSETEIWKESNIPELFYIKIYGNFILNVETFYKNLF